MEKASITVSGRFDSLDRAYSFTDDKTGEVITGLALVINHVQLKEIDLGVGKQMLPINSPIVVSVPKDKVLEVAKEIPNRLNKDVVIASDGIRVSKNEAIFDFAGFVDSKSVSKS